MKVSIAEAKKDFSSVIKQAHREPVVVTRRGQPDIVILSFKEYRDLRRLRAYWRMVRLSHELREAGITATELYQASRQDLEVGQALERMQLFTAEQERVRELNALHTATTVLLTTLDLRILLGHILGAAITAIPAAVRGALILVDEATGQLQVRAMHGYADPHVRRQAFANNPGYVAQAVQERRPLLIPATTTDPFAAHDGDPSEKDATQSAIVAPLILGERVLGALSLGALRREAFTEADLQLLVTFAATATAAIRNARLHAEVQTLAITDALTTLYNRRGFFELGHREVERARRFGRPLAAIMLDLDYFKQVNDTYGHAIGDQVLAKIAARCRAVLREVDLIGRCGGEEFAILLPESDLAGAQQVAERLRRQIAQAAIDTDAGPVTITISAGVAVLRTGHDTLETLLECADRALYAAKQAGRNCVMTTG